MTGRMNMNREAVVRYVMRANDTRRNEFRHPNAGDVAHGLGFETVARARTHIRYCEWAGWIERAGRGSTIGRAMTYRITDAGRAVLSKESERS